MIIGNFPGLLMTFLSLGAAVNVGLEEEGAMMMLAGPLLVLMDVAYRMWPRRGIPDRCGGTVALLPAWTVGLLWFGFGCAYSLGLM
jgi:hypothetical protein